MFRFKAVDVGTSFQCALVQPRERRKHRTSQFSSCTSPTTYKHLVPGRYTFEVRALDAARRGTPARKGFKIS